MTFWAQALLSARFLSARYFKWPFFWVHTFERTPFVHTPLRGRLSSARLSVHAFTRMLFLSARLLSAFLPIKCCQMSLFGWFSNSVVFLFSITKNKGGTQLYLGRAGEVRYSLIILLFYGHILEAQFLFFFSDRRHGKSGFDQLRRFAVSWTTSAKLKLFSGPR